MTIPTLILGSGLAGLATSYHLGHEKCLVLEKDISSFGHVRANIHEGFTWDEGPHISFTKNEYVRDLFAASVNRDFEELEIKTANYFEGHWLDHPAQCSLYQIPEPLRTRCLDSFLAQQKNSGSQEQPPSNYHEWLVQAFGEVFASEFSAKYTRKYWTREPRHLTTDWIGQRVYKPNFNDVIEGYKGPLDRKTYYITHARYPAKGGFESFAKILCKGCNIKFGAEVVRIDLIQQKVWLASGETFSFSRLINTIPLPRFIQLCADVPNIVMEASQTLCCTQLLLVEIMARHPPRRDEHWLYVYDEDKLSTRISFTDRLTRSNVPDGWTGVQTEVYASKYRPFPAAPGEIMSHVIKEAIEMGMISSEVSTDKLSLKSRIRFVPWGNVVFDHHVRPALNKIWNWLEKHGLCRENADLEPITDWNQADPLSKNVHVLMAGRYAQWKYFWTDDCVLRGKQIGDSIGNL